MGFWTWFDHQIGGFLTSVSRGGLGIKVGACNARRSEAFVEITLS